MVRDIYLRSFREVRRRKCTQLDTITRTASLHCIQQMLASADRQWVSHLPYVVGIRLIWCVYRIGG